MNEALEARARALLDDRLFDAYRASVDHFGTTDLILYFDTERDEDPVSAYVRERFISKPDAPRFVGEKFAKPAKDAAVNLKGASTAFWLAVSFPVGMVADPLRDHGGDEGGRA
ncbi:MAG: hypothetical protein IPM79_20865 [Polyangiaceae bacterium]|nr:hypothetical protein [Polyangiaceae bacterium]